MSGAGEVLAGKCRSICCSVVRSRAKMCSRLFLARRAAARFSASTEL